MRCLMSIPAEYHATSYLFFLSRQGHLSRPPVAEVERARFFGQVFLEATFGLQDIILNNWRVL